MTYNFANIGSGSGTAVLALPYGTWTLYKKSSTGALTPVAGLVGALLGVQHRAVAEPVELDHLLGVPNAVLGRVRAQHRQHRAKLLPGQRLVRADLADLCQQQ